MLYGGPAHNETDGDILNTVYPFKCALDCRGTSAAGHTVNLDRRGGHCGSSGPADRADRHLSTVKRGANATVGKRANYCIDMSFVPVGICDRRTAVAMTGCDSVMGDRRLTDGARHRSFPNQVDQERLQKVKKNSSQTSAGRPRWIKRD